MTTRISLAALSLAGVLLTWIAVGSSGCHGCTLEARAGLMVIVIDGSSGSRICDAVVTAHDGTYSETLSPGPGLPGDCDYVGARERAGTYSIEAVAGARTKTVDGVRVTGDECHVMGQAVTVTLNP